MQGKKKRNPGLKRAEQVGGLTEFFLLLADLSAEQHWNICLTATVTGEDIQAKWRVLESLPERQKA